MRGVVATLVVAAALTTSGVSGASTEFRQSAPVDGRRSCAVTNPTGERPPEQVLTEFMAGFNGPPPATLFKNIHGNGTIWTWIYGFLGDEPVFNGDRAIVRPNNVEPDGRFRVKYMWLVATSDPLVVQVRPVGSGESVFTLNYTGEYARASYRPSSLIFPGAGCWAVQAKTGTSELSFVTYVERAK